MKTLEWIGTIAIGLASVLYAFTLTALHNGFEQVIYLLILIKSWWIAPFVVGILCFTLYLLRSPQKTNPERAAKLVVVVFFLIGALLLIPVGQLLQTHIVPLHHEYTSWTGTQWLHRAWTGSTSRGQAWLWYRCDSLHLQCALIQQNLR